MRIDEYAECLMEFYNVCTNWAASGSLAMAWLKTSANRVRASLNVPTIISRVSVWEGSKRKLHFVSRWKHNKKSAKTETHHHLCIRFSPERRD